MSVPRRQRSFPPCPATPSHSPPHPLNPSCPTALRGTVCAGASRRSPVMACRRSAPWSSGARFRVCPKIAPMRSLGICPKSASTRLSKPSPLCVGPVRDGGGWSAGVGFQGPFGLWRRVQGGRASLAGPGTGHPIARCAMGTPAAPRHPLETPRPAPKPRACPSLPPVRWSAPFDRGAQGTESGPGASPGRNLGPGRGEALRPGRDEDRYGEDQGEDPRRRDGRG